MFDLVTKYKPTGDQPEAIEKISNNLKQGMKYQTLLGATGTGKTFTIANVIKNIGKKTLVLAHNKTLAGQLYAELKSLFPNNKVEYFISYYDYYQPEAYVSSKDLYIEKDSSINEEIDQMRNSAASSLLLDDDVIVVSSVSCIYSIGDPNMYKNNLYAFEVGQTYKREDVLDTLIGMNYMRNDYQLERGTFRVKGEAIDIFLRGSRDDLIRLEFFDDELESIKIINAINHNIKRREDRIVIYPATLFNVDKEKRLEALKRIEKELEDRIKYFEDNDQLLEAQRIKQRTLYDIEMIRELGFCSGIENYSRHLALRGEDETPYTLMDYFNKDFLLVIDESHVTIPQVRAMYKGDRSRKQNLVDYGFRLPSALDNRPLRYSEFEEKCDQVVYVSATPAVEQIEKSEDVIQQIIRPTFLLDPEIEIRPSDGQIDDLVKEIFKRKNKNERVLVLTLTIKLSEELHKYLRKLDIKAGYLHSEIKSLERMKIINDLRTGVYDCLVGINLLREGLDLPEVSLIAILDADKEGFLRSETSLIQIIGRAARNSEGRVIMYADNETGSMTRAISETNRRREIQDKYNKSLGITPKTIIKEVRNDFEKKKYDDILDIDFTTLKKKTKFEKKKLIESLEKKMMEKAHKQEFEEAMTLRDIIYEIRGML